MTFQGNGPLDTSGVSGSGGGGGGRGIALGGGAGVIVTIVALLFGINPGDIMGGSSSNSAATSPGTNTEIQQHIDSCTIEKANTDTVCRIVATTVSLKQVWTKLYPDYTQPQTRIFSQAVSTGGCGNASSATGPFYCPADQTAYFDTSFFDEMLSQLGGSTGPLAQEYVVAHEFGHHIENLQGILRKGQSQGNLGSRKIELQADCLAGVWANHADDGPDAMIAPISQQQVSDVIQTAAAIGDDKLSGSSNPEGWTHGSSEQREHWFSVGYQSGDMRQCDTFAPGAVS